MNRGAVSPVRLVSEDDDHDRGSNEEEEEEDDVFHIPPKPSIELLKKWRKATLELNATRRFRYVLDLENVQPPGSDLEKNGELVSRFRTVTHAIRGAVWPVGLVSEDDDHDRGRNEEDEEEDDVFHIPPKPSIEMLTKWRKATLELNATRRFRYVLDLNNVQPTGSDLEKNGELVSRFRTVIHAIRAVQRFKQARKRCNEDKLNPPPDGFGIGTGQLVRILQDQQTAVLDEHGGVEAVAKQLRTDLEDGIEDDPAELEKRQEAVGVNKIPSKPGKHFLAFRVLQALKKVMCRSTDSNCGISKPRGDELVSKESSLQSSWLEQHRWKDNKFSSSSSGLENCAEEFRASKQREQPPVTGRGFVEIEETRGDQHPNSRTLAVPVETLGTTLRPDVAAVGIDNFECPFDSRKILCLQRKVAKDEDFVKLVFFHPEGMAQIVGVGLPFSEVVLREHHNLEVRELSQGQWRERWMAKCFKNSTLILFSRENTPEEPYKLRCAEPDLHRTGVCETGRPVQWIGGLVKLLRGSGHYPSSPGAESEIGSSFPRLVESGLKITVFFSPSREELIVPEASDWVVQKSISSRWSCRSGHIADTVDNTRALSAKTRTYQLEARAVIEFSSVAEPTGTSACQSFRSTLQVDFNMPRVPRITTENRKIFGWYQDHLGVSLRCMQDGAVRKETKGIDQEVLSQHRVSLNQRSRDMEETISTIAGKSGNAVIGVSTPAKVGLSLSLKKEKTTTKGRKLQTSSELMQRILEEGNFRIKYCGATSILAYGFTHSPPSESFNVWDVPEDREALSCDVMTSNIPIEVMGMWKIVDGAEIVSNGVCQFEFLCERLLSMHQLVTVESKSKIIVSDCFVSQGLKKQLYVNHRFSHNLGQHKPRYYQEYVCDKYRVSHPIGVILF